MITNSVQYVRLHPILMSILLLSSQTANGMHVRSRTDDVKVRDLEKGKGRAGNTLLDYIY